MFQFHSSLRPGISQQFRSRREKGELSHPYPKPIHQIILESQTEERRRAGSVITAAGYGLQRCGVSAPIVPCALMRVHKPGDRQGHQKKRSVKMHSVKI